MLDSAQEILKLQSQGEATAVEITTSAIERIEATQQSVNAFTHINRELAISSAEKVDEKRRLGEPLGALAGVPVAVKDVLCTHCLLYTSPSPRDRTRSRMQSSA